MEAAGLQQCRKVDCTPPLWMERGWRVEFTKRTSSDKYDILITTPLPWCQKLRSLKAFLHFATENKITGINLEDLHSHKQRILWKKKSLQGIHHCADSKKSPHTIIPCVPVIEGKPDTNSSCQNEDKKEFCDPSITDKQPFVGSLAVANCMLGCEASSMMHCSLLGSGGMTDSGGASVDPLPKEEVLDGVSSFLTEESVVGSCVRRHYATVPLPLGGSAEDMADDSMTVGSHCCEDVDSLTVSENCPVGTPDGSSKSTNTGGEHDVSWSPERAGTAGSRLRRKQDQCVSPYFRKRVKGMEQLESEGTLQSLGPGKHHWMPPRSPYGLIQEELYHDPFQLLVATILLNKTRGEAATPVIWRLLEKWPTPEAILKAKEEDLVTVIQPLGLQRKRAFIIKKFAEEFLGKQWTYPDELYGISKYGADSYRIFCVDEWQDARPTDHMLLKYVKWLNSKQSLLLERTLSDCELAPADQLSLQHLVMWITSASSNMESAEMINKKGADYLGIANCRG